MIERPKGNGVSTKEAVYIVIIIAVVMIGVVCVWPAFVATIDWLDLIPGF